VVIYTYERFLQLPVLAVLVVLWVAGAVLEVACVMALYQGGLALVRVLEAVL
jgi:hypothetical protein